MQEPSAPPPAYSDVVGHGDPPSAGQTPPSQNVVHGQRLQYDGQPIAAQPATIQQPYGQLMAPQSGIHQQEYGQSILIQNQYGQPIIVQGGVQTVGVVAFGIDPHHPSQNESSVSTKCPHCHADITTTTVCRKVVYLAMVYDSGFYGMSVVLLSSIFVERYKGRCTHMSEL